MRSAITTAPIDAGALLREVSRPRNGASVLFVGTVRDQNEGRPVTGIAYAAYERMAERELERIVRECALRFGTEDVVAEHRIGQLDLGDMSVAIAVAHPHRAQAYDASRWVIEEVKRRLPVWKREEYVDGTREWVGNRESGRGNRRPNAGVPAVGAGSESPDARFPGHSAP